MDSSLVITLSLVFLAAVPLNVWVAREVRRYARMDPPIDILSLLSQLVNILALIASVVGIIAFASVVTLTTAIRLIPVPGSTIALVGVLLVASTANVLTWLFLRRARKAQDHP